MYGQNPKPLTLNVGARRTKNFRYVIIRGEVYDVTDFEHPGGQHMMDLAIARDATIMLLDCSGFRFWVFKAC